MLRCSAFSPIKKEQGDKSQGKKKIPRISKIEVMEKSFDRGRN